MNSTSIALSLRANRIFQTASLLLAMLFSFTALGQTTNPPVNSSADEAANKARAQSVLKQTRDALGGDANLSALKSLTISGDFRSAMGGREIKGDFKVEMLLPDKYQRTVRTTVGPMVMTRIETTNGIDSWRDTKRDMAAAGGGGFGAEGGGGFGGGGAGAGGGGGGGFGGGGAGGGGGFGGGGGRGGRGGGGGVGDFGGPAAGGRGNTGIVGEASPETQKQIKEEYSRLLVMLLAGASASSSFEYMYDRELEAKEGKVDVIRVTGKDDFVAWMMIDRRTYRPWMIVYRALAQRPMRQPNQSPTIVGEGNTEEPKLLDYQLFFADYKQEGNVWFPHQIVRVLNNQMQEEWKLNKIKVNADIKANKFDKKK